MRFATASIALLALVLSTAARAGTTEKVDHFGSVDVVEEVRVKDPGELPIMHVAQEWTKLHVRWKSPDMPVALKLTDDGSQLSLTIDAGECLAAAGYLTYSEKAGEPELFRFLRIMLQNLGPKCSGSRQLIEEFSASRADFSAAVEELKRRAVVQFNRLRPRCVAPGAPPGPCQMPTLRN